MAFSHPNLASVLSISTWFLKIGSKCLNYEQTLIFFSSVSIKKKIIFLLGKNTLSPPGELVHQRLAVLSMRALALAKESNICAPQ